MNRKLIWTTIILSLLGLFDSIYLYIYKLSKNNAMCLGSGDCATVNSSPYSMLYGIPVSVLGIIAYLVILILLFFELKEIFFRENSNYIVFGISLIGVLFSTYLTYVEYFVIFAVCPFCVASAIIIVIIFIISIIRLIKAIK